MCPEDLVLLVSSVAIAIAREQSPELVAVYAAIFSMLGDTLVVLLTQKEFLENCKNQSDESTFVF